MDITAGAGLADATEPPMTLVGAAEYVVGAAATYEAGAATVGTL